MSNFAINLAPIESQDPGASIGANFTPHKYNSKQEIIKITFPEIVKMKVSKTLGMVTNKLSILLTSGSYDFIVDEPRRWEIMIKEQIR